MSDPTATKTYRIRDLMLARKIAEGLINHRQWFTFSPVIGTHFPDDQYEFVLDATTPQSGYNFEPTSSIEIYENQEGYGLEIHGK